MIYLAIPFAMLLLLVLWVLFVPVYLKVNTECNLYSISQLGTVLFTVQPGEDPFIKMKLFGWRIRPGKNAKSHGTRTETTKHKTKKSKEAWVVLFRGMINSLRCKKCNISMDTGDVVLNAQLLPLMVFVNQEHVRLKINFHNENFIELNIEAKLGKMLGTYIRFLTLK